MILKSDDILTSSGKYKERATSPECSVGVKANASDLATRVNKLLAFCGVPYVSVSSGFRTAASNAALANSAKKSAHMLGKAVDLVDKDNALYNKIYAWCEKDKWVLCKDLGLWLEDKGSTPTWCHIDMSVRSDRPIRVFKP
jgi:hypothetical protein